MGKDGCVAALVPLCVTGWCLGEEERILVVVGRRRKKKQGVGEVSCVSILGRSRQNLGLSGVLGGKGRANRRRRKADWCQRRLRERGNKSRGGKGKRLKGWTEDVLSVAAKEVPSNLCVSGAPSGSLSSFWRVPRQSSVGARYTRVKGTRKGLDNCVEEGGILLVSGTPRPSSRVPPTCCLVTRSLQSVCWLSVCPFPLNNPACMCCCAGCAPRLLFFFFFLAHGTANPFITHPRSAAIGGSIIPGQGFLLGIAPAGWQNACGGPFEFQFPAWLVWSGLWFFFLSLGEGQSRDRRRRGFQGTAIQRHRPPDGRCAPGVITVGAHRPQQTGQPRRTTDDGRMDDQARGSRNTKPQKPNPTNHYVHIVNGRVCC